MQAADLLAVIAPNAGQGAASGMAGSKLGLGLGKGAGVQVDEATDGANPFAQALAALMAATPTLAQPQTPAVTGDDKTSSDQANPASAAAPFAKGLQVAVAAG